MILKVNDTAKFNIGMKLNIDWKKEEIEIKEDTVKEEEPKKHRFFK